MEQIDRLSNNGILIVDDEVLLRALYRHVLEEAGFDICEAGNGEEAFQVYQEEIPSLILTDIYMPVMNGYEFIRRVRQLDNQTPVIVMSGEEDALAQGLKYGANAKFKKTSELNNLVDLVAGLLG